jgi:hypothetical protein
VIVPDTNVLIYAHNNRSEHHQVARRWWRDCLVGDELIGLPWVVTTGFVRVTTNPRITGDPLTPEQAVDFVIEWLEALNVVPIEPGPNHLTHLRRNLVAAGAGGNLVPDAHIAALAMEYDAEVHSHDSDFGRFPGVRWHDPIAAPR